MKEKMKIFSLLFVLLMFSFCVTQKQRERILKECPISSKESTTDSTWKKETVKKDTFYKSIPGPIRYFASPCADLCDSLGKLKPFKVETSKNGIKQTLETIGDVLVQKCDVDSLMQVNELKTIEINRLLKQIKETTVRDNCQKKHFSDLDTFFNVSAKILYSILALYILFRLLKIWLKGKVPFL
jgi:hypothetical protein